MGFGLYLKLVRGLNKMTDLIKLRKKIKDKKPDFVRQHGYKKKKLSKSGWRAPKGMHSKMRRKMGGKRKLPSMGYSSPRAVRGFTRQGFKPFIVKTLKDINKIKDEIIIIGKKVGLRKKIQLLEKIKQLKLKVENVKDIDKFIKKVKENLEKRKTKRKEEKKTKETKKPKEKEKKEITEEEKEKKEKEEKRKVLEQK
jgi:large subunit ribosomal protein L32e